MILCACCLSAQRATLLGDFTAVLENLQLPAESHFLDVAVLKNAGFGNQ
jgi:hypothetical protein